MPSDRPHVTPNTEAGKERIRQAYTRLDAKLAARAVPSGEAAPAQEAAPVPESLQIARDSSFLPQGVTDFGASANAGIQKALFETKDFLVGEPAEEDKSQFRRNIEAQDKFLDDQSAGYGVTSSISQMAVGLIGAGKLLAPVKLLAKGKELGKVALTAFEMAKGAVAGAVVLDPHEERLSDFLEEFEGFQQPVFEYLAADPDDSVAEGRFKNIIESIGVDFALLGIVKAIKLLKAGKTDAAVKEINKLEAEQTAKAVEPEAAPAAALEAVPGSPEAGTIEQIGTKAPVDAKGNPILPTAKVAPKTVVVEEIADADIEKIVKSTEADQAAVKKYGSRTEAIAEGHKFGGDTKLPWQKLHIAGGAQSLMERTTQVMAKRYNVAKGGAILKDERVVAVANEIADLYGEDPAMVLGQLAKAGQNAAEMTARMEAGLRLGNRMFMDAEKLRVDIKNQNFKEFGGNPEMAAQEWMGRLAVALDTTASANSILSNSGRTLRRAQQQFRFKPADLARFKAMDPQKALVIVEKAGGDLKKVSMLLNETWAARVLNEATWHMTNGLLWMWPTHLVNTTTNAFMMAARPSEKLFGSAALRLVTKDPGKRAELSSLSRQALREYTYTITSLADGWSNAVEAFRRGDSILNPHNTEFFDGGTSIVSKPLPWKPWNSVMDLAENAWMSANYRNMVGLPTRVLGGQDEFFKTLRYRAVVQSKAAVDASDRGLTGDAAKQYVQKAMDAAIDPANGKAIDQKAVAEAQRATFQQDLNYSTHAGSVGMALQNFRKTFPAAGLVVPFLKTPINVIRYGLKLTPGLNLLQKEFLDDLSGKVGTAAQAHAVGQMAMGSMLMGLAAHLAVSDRFTGGGPQNSKLKQELVATGWKPYSIKWTDEEGVTNYFQLGRFDPVGMVMGMVADIVAIKKKDPDGEHDKLILAAGLAVAKSLGDKAFLLTLDSAIGALMDPMNQGTKFAGRTIGAMVPFSSLARGHNTDPYLREARGFVDTVMAGLPGLSSSLPVTMDIWGDPIERHVGVMDSGEHDIVESEHNRIMLQTDKGIGKPSPTFEGVGLRDITLVSGKNAYQRLQELSGHLPKGPSLKEVIKRVVESEGYQDLPDGDSDVQGTRLFVLGRTVHEYGKAAKLALLQENKELQPLIKARQRDARGAILENRKKRGAGQPGARELLEALGGTQ